MQTTMNVKVKFARASPVRTELLEEKAPEYFELDAPSPYMLLVAPVNEKIRTEMTDEQQDLPGIDKLKVKRSDLPAITHVDYSARVQTVTPIARRATTSSSRSSTKPVTA